MKNYQKTCGKEKIKQKILTTKKRGAKIIERKRLRISQKGGYM